MQRSLMYLVSLLIIYASIPLFGQTQTEREILTRHERNLEYVLAYDLSGVETGAQAEEIAQRVLLAQFNAHQSNSKAAIPLHLRPQVSINGVSIEAPSTLEELPQYVKALAEAIDQSPTPEFDIQIRNKSYRGKKTPLGQGNQGIAYDLGETVLKIPRPRFAPIASMLLEVEPNSFFERKSAHSRFQVTRRLETNPLGLFAISEKNFGEPMTLTLLRAGILVIQNGQVEIESDESRWTLSPKEVAKLSDAVEDLAAIMRKTPQMSLSISPNNLHVTFADPGKSIIKEVTLIDFGPYVIRMIPEEKLNAGAIEQGAPELATFLKSQGIGIIAQKSNIATLLQLTPFTMLGKSYYSLSEYNQARSFPDFLLISARKVAKYLKNGYIAPELMKYSVLFNGQSCKTSLRGSK